MFRPAMLRSLLWFALPAGALLAEQGATAQEAPRNLTIFQRSIAAPSHALELGVGTGYNQGVGALDGEGIRHVQDIAGVGIGLDVGAGYRISPRIGVGAFAAGALYKSLVPDVSARSFAFGAQASWHLRPYRSIDPWISFGGGYRLFWESPPAGGTITRRALQVGRLAIGVDYRFSPEVAVGPYIAGDISMFFSTTLPDGTSPSRGNALSTFVSAGVAARFDLLGRAEIPTIDIAAR